MKKFIHALSVGAFSLAALAVPLAAAASDADIQAKLRAEEAQSSKIMWLMHHISDVYGPRLTGSPQLKAADDWAVRTMTSWGLKNAHLEGYDFGHAGWANQLTEASVTAPYQAPLTARAMPWTPSTKGLVTANAVLLLPPGVRAAGATARRSDAVTAAAQAGSSPAPMPAAEVPAPMPTQAELTAYLNSMKDKVRGAIVLVGPNAEPFPNFIPPAYRTSDEQWESRYNPKQDAAGNAPANGPGRPGGAGAETPAADPSRLTAGEIDVQITKFLFDNGALLHVHDAGEYHGILRVQDVGGYNEANQVPGIMLANSDYGRIARVLRQDNAPVKLRVNVQNEFYPDGKTVYNALGEIAGTDKKDEVVMLGGHFDSWASATGATDNGAGSAVMLEAVRLLQTLGVKPRRTIRVALWSGEEQGIFGSQAYVEKHFGTAENPKPEFSKLNAYINIDSGTGKPRGAGVFGPPAAAQFIAKTMAGFKDWGFVGANASNGRNIGGTDSTSFNHAGLPGIGLNQDAFDYNTHTHHTLFDTYEAIYEPDMREAAVETAALAYALAMSDEMLPRFGKTDMPAPGKGLTQGERTMPAGDRGKRPAQ